MGGMFSSGFNPNKLVPGKLYSTLDGKIYTYIGSEERVGMVTPGTNSKPGSVTVYKFEDKAEPIKDGYDPVILVKKTMDNLGLKPMTGGRRKTRHGNRARKAKTAKKGKK